MEPVTSGRVPEVSPAIRKFSARSCILRRVRVDERIAPRAIPCIEVAFKSLHQPNEFEDG